MLTAASPCADKETRDKAVKTLTRYLKSGPVLNCADTYVPEPPYCTYGLRAPTSCVLYVPKAQGSLPRGATHCTSLGCAVYTVCTSRVGPYATEGSNASLAGP